LLKINFQKCAARARGDGPGDSGEGDQAYWQWLWEEGIELLGLPDHQEVQAGQLSDSAEQHVSSGCDAAQGRSSSGN